MAYLHTHTIDLGSIEFDGVTYKIIRIDTYTLSNDQMIYLIDQNGNEKTMKYNGPNRFEPNYK